MLKLLRYTLAAIFLAASVGCLGLWWRSMSHDVRTFSPTPFQSTRLYLETRQGYAMLSTMRSQSLGPTKVVSRSPSQVRYEYTLFKNYPWHNLAAATERRSFGTAPQAIFFPLWYPAIVFAFAAVGTLRIGQRFTIRSALFATTVVAVLLGIVVTL